LGDASAGSGYGAGVTIESGGSRVERVEQAERVVRGLRAAGRLAEAARLIGDLGPYGVAEDGAATVSLGAAVLEAYGDQLGATDREAADAAFRRAAEDQRSFAAAATSGGEGTARMMEAARIDAKRLRRRD
jgi:hypothetical protein